MIRPPLLRLGLQTGLVIVLAVTALATATTQQYVRRVEPAGIPVRFAEGMAHGFLELRNEAGVVIASGDLLQVAKGSVMETRLVFHFVNKSVFEETVTFTQNKVFEMQSYHLVQRGPAFTDDLDASLSRSGRYVVKSTSHKDGETKEYTGTVDLPPDISNGMVITLAKNLVAGETQRVHLLAFTPKPRLIKLEFIPSGTVRLKLGTHEETAVHYVLKPHLGEFIGFFARLLGKMPPDSHAWILTDEVPAFVRFQGPMYLGPVWRLDLTSPAWSR